MSPTPNASDVLSLLLEIVSCRDLMIADRTTSDPYVKVELGDKDLHKTKHLLKTLNPVFSEKEHNVCVVNVKYGDIVQAGGITFEAKDWDRIGSNESLGKAIATAEDLISTVAAGGGTTELRIGAPSKHKSTSFIKPFGRGSSENTAEGKESEAGYITIRVQLASDTDRSKYGAESGATFWVPKVEAPELAPEEEPVFVTSRDLEPDSPEAKSAAADAAEAAAIPEEPASLTGSNATKVTAVEPDVTIDDTETIEFAIDIVKCQNLLAADRTGLSDPYVKVHFGAKDLHKTKTIQKTLNPVFDKDSNSSFVLKCSGKDFTATDGLVFEVKDWDRGIGGNDPLGEANVSAKQLYAAAMDPEGDGFVTASITPPPGKEGQEAGSITIRGRAVRFGQAETTTISRDAPVVVPAEDKEVLIEIISCRDLLAADKTGLSDPYVKIKLGSKELHRTAHVEKTLNPAYSVEHSKFFIIDCTAKELFEEGGVELKVKDYDRGLGKHDDLGSVQVSADTLYNTTHAETDSLELGLNPPKGHGEKAGFVTIRLRTPTLGDKEDLKAKKGLRGRIVPNIMKKKEADQREIAVAQSMDLIDKEDKVFLIEIVSCRGLLAADKTGASDPYIKVKMDGKDIHKTKHVLKTLDPVFTEETNNAFVLDCPVMELYAKNGIFVKVKDWDRGIGGDDDLGSLQIPADVLYDFGSEAKEFKIDPPSGKSDAAGFITIRCNPISAAERDARKKGGMFSRLTGITSTATTARDMDLSDLSLLIEIVSCQNLIQADVDGGSDPYVKVKLGDKDIHKTQYISNNQNPIYTIKTGSLFVLNVMKQEFIEEKDAVTFIVKDFDAVGMSNDELGTVSVSGEDLIKANGERMVLKLNPKKGSKHKEAGVINIRCRPASNYDKKFLEYANGDRKGDFLGIGANTDIIMNPRGGSTALVKSTLTKDDGGVKKNRVRPEPDPERPAVTKWLSDEEIQELALKPSRRWVGIGSGKLGRIYLEIIGANGLPNLDTSIRGRDKSDPFAMIVYEDCCAKTDIIDDCLSPRWLPWMQRAFVLHMDHSSSDVFVGVFDYDPSLGGGHDLIGRFAVETSSLRPDTEYVLSYNLYEDSFSKDRKAMGSVTVRIRVEFDSQKQLVLSNLRVPEDEYINVKKKKDFHLIRQVVQGKTDLTAYSLGTVMLYVDELQSYLYLKYYLVDAVISLLLWRGQVPFFGIRLPLHSLIAFFAAISMAERPTLYFAYFWWGNAWLLLAIQNWKNNTPHPWCRSKSFASILRMMILNMAMTGPENIPANHNEKEAREWEAEMEERIKKAEAEAEKRREEELKILAEHEKEVADLDQTAETDISTKTGGVSLGPMAMLKPYLYPIQQQLATVCYGLRVLSNVYTWEEPYLAFFFTLASISVGCVFIVIPWSFLIRWTGRILAWGLFGPHMKAVDVFYYSKLKESTEDEERKLLADYYKAQKELAHQNALVARIQTEDAVKLSEIKKVLYGKYICRVPVIKGERFRDTPLLQSYAKPYKPDKEYKSEPIVIGGQRFVGNMIPQLKALEKSKKEAESKQVEDNPAATDKTPLLK